MEPFSVDRTHRGAPPARLAEQVYALGSNPGTFLGSNPRVGIGHTNLCDPSYIIGKP